MPKLLYGATEMLHGYCATCDDTTFADDEMRCLDCKAPVTIERKVRREVRGTFRRKKPTLAHQRALIERQRGRCFWCGYLFGSHWVSPGNRLRKLMPVFDHFVPFAYTGSCDDREFVASCSICNGIKTSHMFDSEDECRAYVVRKAAAKGWRLLSEPDDEWCAA
jgi:5-methylcytosine-specific restriction endonuclease McrA